MKLQLIYKHLQCTTINGNHLQLTPTDRQPFTIHNHKLQPLTSYLQPIYNHLQSTTINYNHLQPFTINLQVITIHLQFVYN